MDTIKVLAIVLLVAGGLGLAYGGFTYTRDTHQAQVGPLELTVEDRETVHIPLWLGVGAMALGGALLLFGGKRT